MAQLWGTQLSRQDLMRRVGRLEQVAGVRLVTLGDGIERGVRVLEFRTGSGLSFDVLVDRCMDIGRCEFLGQSLTWLSATGVVGPWYAEPMGLGWFRTWGGGMLVTCGLDHTLLGGVDDASNFHQKVRPTEEYGLMGRIGFAPAKLVGYGERWEGDELVLWAEGIVRQAAVFGEALELRRRIEVNIGDSVVRITDDVVNVGFDRTSHMFLYHMNIGYPVLDEGSELLIDAPPGRPVDSYPPADYRIMTGPQPAAREQCWEHDVRPDSAGLARAALINPKLDLGVYQRYNQDALPFHTTWRMLGEGTYGVALEATTNRDAGRFDAAERGELQWLGAGEGRRYSLEIGVLSGSAQVEAYRSGDLRPLA
jgi:hypothetical protein